MMPDHESISVNQVSPERPLDGRLGFAVGSAIGSLPLGGFAAALGSAQVFVPAGRPDFIDTYYYYYS